jgi:hypothetical protein
MVWSKPESHLEGRPLWTGKPIQKTSRRKQKLMQAGEREVCLGLHTRRREHPHACRPRSFRGRGQQRGLADPSFAANYERPAMTRDPIDYPIQPP